MAFHHSSKIVTDGLVLYLDAADKNSYPGSGTTWTDLSPNGNNATLNAAGIGTVSSSLSEGVMAFNGGSDYTTVSDSNDFHFSTGNFTIEFWVKRPAGAGTGPIYEQYLNGTNFQQIFYHSNDYLYYYVYDAGSAEPYLNTSNALSTDTWHHCVFIRYGTGSNNMYVYVDTVSQAINWNSGLDADRDIPNLAADVWFVKTDPYGYGTFGGQISSIKIYKGKALSAKEVSQNFNAHRSRFGV